MITPDGLTGNQNSECRKVERGRIASHLALALNARLARQTFVRVLNDATTRVAESSLSEQQNTWAFVTTPYHCQINEEPAHVVLYGFLTGDADEAELRYQQLREYIKAAREFPENPILQMLLAQSYLRVVDFDYSFLEPVAQILREELLLPSENLRMDVPSYEKLFRPLQDILEKLGIVVYSTEVIAHAPPGFSEVHVKASFYMFIWATKAMCDSIAVFLRSFHGLNVPWHQTELDDNEFLKKLTERDEALAKSLSSEFGQWVSLVTKFRNLTIHRHGFRTWRPVGSRHYQVPREPEIRIEGVLVTDPLMDARVPPERLAEHYTEAIARSQEWRDQCERLLRFLIGYLEQKLR